MKSIVFIYENKDKNIVCDKTEDIINHTGGTLCLEVWNSRSEAGGYAVFFETDFAEKIQKKVRTVKTKSGICRFERFDKKNRVPYNRHTVSEERIYYVYLRIITG